MVGIGGWRTDNGICVVWFSLQRSQQKMRDPDAVLHIPVLRGAHDTHHSAVLQDLPHPVQSTEPVQDRYSWGREERRSQGQDTIQNGCHQNAMLVFISVFRICLRELV
ncbi:hypothetical protein CDAR_417881 [Caerostris darwini]|uniref:Uncharacterized protein n=1 Tax=Caerostris darwini TaxID=1538125 RepID=A0AAV4W6P7_9ARAC|nr:hypothetical protein CDAR_417881 [Caerostris darwini]